MDNSELLIQLAEKLRNIYGYYGAFNAHPGDLDWNTGHSYLAYYVEQAEDLREHLPEIENAISLTAKIQHRIEEEILRALIQLRNATKKALLNIPSPKEVERAKHEAKHNKKGEREWHTDPVGGIEYSFYLSVHDALSKGVDDVCRLGGFIGIADELEIDGGVEQAKQQAMREFSIGGSTEAAIEPENKLKNVLPSHDGYRGISEYLDNLDKRVEQWDREYMIEAANDTLIYMDNQLSELNKIIGKLDEKTSQAEMVLKSKAKILQRLIKGRVERIKSHLVKLTKLQKKLCPLIGEMESVASGIKTSFANDNPKPEKTGETLDETLKRKADDLNEWAKDNLKDYLYPWDNVALDFEIRNQITIRGVLGSAFDDILMLLRIHPLYSNYNEKRDLAGSLENKRNDFLSYLDELEGKTTPKNESAASKEDEAKAVNCTHSPNFSEVNWFGTKYKFNKNQAIAIKFLWKAYEAPDKVGVHETDIAQAVDSSSERYRLLQLFRMHQGGRHVYHPAWRTMIISLGSHLYTLKPPNN